MVDSRGQEVGESTGEGQILKFAFVSAIVALAARKIGPKTAFLAPSTVAPLVLDAPFSALDPEYQSSVARNLVAHASQVVLLISSAAWSPGVSAALTPTLGRRYVLISRESGKRGSKPVKEMLIGDQNVVLNEYDAERDETIVREFSV
jgi:DNA sulfur modification protein DndD